MTWALIRACIIFYTGNRLKGTQNKWRPEITTLILGAKCKDGVVLVGDRYVKSDFGANYREKIKKCGDINWAVFGAAGVGPLFEEFLSLLPPIVSKSFGWVNYQKQHLDSQHVRAFPDNPKATLPPMLEYTYDNFKQDCVKLLTQMKKRYSVAFQYKDCILQILLGTKEGENAKLYYLDSRNCLPVPVPEAVLIGQSQLGEWLRKGWNPNMTMQQTAKLGILAVKYLEKEEISKEIGVGNYFPQVWYIADGNNIQPREILDVELQTLVSDADKKCKSLQRKVHSLFGT